jgi:hypothetical protein
MECTAELDIDLPATATDVPQPLFDFGFIVAAPGAIRALNSNNEKAATYLIRHVSGDWSEMSEVDQMQNAYAVQKGLRVFSSFVLACGKKMWIVTEWDRSVTTLLMPAEY